MPEKKNYLPVIWQSILIGSAVMGLVYFPVNIKFEAVSKEINQVKKDHIDHCMVVKAKFEKVPDLKLVELQFVHIDDKLEDIKKEQVSHQKILQEILIKVK